LPINWKTVLRSFQGRIKVVERGQLWHVRGFLTFQNPRGLSERHEFHKKVIALCHKRGITPVLQSKAKPKAVVEAWGEASHVLPGRTQEEGVDSILGESAERGPGSDLTTPSQKPPRPLDPEQAWRLERLEPWARALVPVVGTKLGKSTWPQYRRLVEVYGLAAVLAAAEATPSTERWADKIEARLAPVEVDGPLGPQAPWTAEQAEYYAEVDRQVEADRAAGLIEERYSPSPSKS
jgi:hypothetical protein